MNDIRHPLQESVAPTPGRGWLWPVTAGVALVYLAIAGAYVCQLPPLGGPDEHAHLRYVQVLREHWRLPVLPRLARPGQEGLVAEQAQHPPLYYAALAAASYVLPDLDTARGQRALKLLSVLMGLGAILVTALLAGRLWPDDDLIAAAAVAVVALLPSIPYMTALLNNSAGSLLGSALALVALERAVAAPDWRWTRWAKVGLVAALAMLAKITAIWLLPAIAVTLVLKIRSGRPGWRPAVAVTAAALLPVALLVGAWLLRNQISFGELMPERVLGRRYMPDGLAVIFFEPFAAWLLAWVVAINIPLSMTTPVWILRSLAQTVDLTKVFACLLVFLAPAAIGLAWAAWRRRGRVLLDLSPRRAFLIACGAGGLGAWFVAMQAVLHDWNTGMYAGRYALEAAPALGLLWAAGARELLPNLTARQALVGLWMAGLLASCLWTYHMLMGFFGPGVPQ